MGGKMSKQVTVRVIHYCKSCNDEGVKITNDEVVKCYDCDTIKNNHDAKSWFEIKKDKTIGVKSGIHLTKFSGQPWTLMK
jgi:hypothetical protein